jgi:ACR3 family arsenite transporter
MSFFERHLTAWVFLCIIIGIGVGKLMPGVSHAVGSMEYANVNLPVGLLIWVMIIPMLMKVDFGALAEMRQHVRGIGVTLVCELAGETVLHGFSWLDFYTASVCASVAR